jgi:hypothetical protein
MPEFRGVEWLNANEERSYPLSSGATKRDVTGTFTLPDSFLVELYLATSSALNVDTTQFYLQSLTVLPTGYNVTIGYNDGSGNPPTVGTAVIAAATAVEFGVYELPGVGDFEDISGKLTIGRLNEINAQPAGEFAFAPSGGLLDSDCIRPTINGVASLSVVNGTASSARLYGDIELIAGTNISLTATGGGVIRIDAITGAGLTAACDCTADATPAPALRTINGVPPDVNGDFTLSGNDCITIAPLSTGLAIDNTCGTPCCGCTELQALTAELAHFGEEGTTLRNFINALSSEFNKFNAAVLGSKLGDAGCISC